MADDITWNEAIEMDRAVCDAIGKIMHRDGMPAIHWSLRDPELAQPTLMYTLMRGSFSGLCEDGPEGVTAWAEALGFAPEVPARVGRLAFAGTLESGRRARVWAVVDREAWEASRG